LRNSMAKAAPKKTAKPVKAKAKAAPKQVAKPAPPKAPRSSSHATPAAATDSVAARIAELGGWRSATLGLVRTLIREADPDVVEELKWRKASNPGGVPVWSHGGPICTGESYKDHVKLTFFKGAQVPDPKRLFNAGLDGARRAIDIQEGDQVDATAFKALVRAAVALNEPVGKAKPKRST
jgi:hypothetical protein